MRARAPLSVLSLGAGCMLFFGLGQGCGDATPPPSPVLSLRAGTTTVEIATGAFGLTFVQDGERVTGTIARGDDAHAPAMATHEVLEEQGRGLPGWDGYAPVVGPWALSGRARVLSESGDAARLAIEAPGGEVLLTVSVGARRVELTLEANGGEPAWNKLGLTLGAAPDEHFFGMGERFASTDHRGLALYSWAEEGGVGKGEAAPRAYDNPGPNGPSMTYFPVPFFLSSKGFGVHLDTTHRTVVDFAEKRADALTLTADAPRLRVVVYLSRDPKDTLGAFVADTGRPFVPAPWVFGPRRRVGVNALVDGVPEWKLMRDRDIPITTIDDAVHFLPARSEAGREDTLREWTRTVHAAGYKVVAYLNPYVATAPEIADDFAYGKERGLFFTEPSGAPGTTIFSSGRLLELASIDLTQPEGVAWFQTFLRRPLALGYDGWMHDFGEYTERRWRAKDGRTGVELHNLYPVLSAKAAHDLLEKERPGDYLFFVRSGYTGSQQYIPMVWGGDPESTFDETQGLIASLRGGLNLGMSGVPVWGSDVSGYKCVTSAPNDKEIYLRWVELGAVSPVFQEQNACANPVGAKKEKWSLFKDQETQDVYRAMTRLHTRLGLYVHGLAIEANATGVPITRHPFLVHPTAPEAYAVEDSFYVGRSLFTSPVVRRGQTTKALWLPPGRFVDLATSEVLEGGRRVEVPAPLGHLPLWLTEGALLPMYDARIDTLAPATDPEVVTPERVADRLDVLVVPAKAAAGAFRLADGTELSYESRGDAGEAPASFARVPEADLAECATCVSAGPHGGVARTRVNTALAAESEVVLGGLVLRHKGPRPRRVRWDVRRLP